MAGWQNATRSVLRDRSDEPDDSPETKDGDQNSPSNAAMP